MRCQAGELRGEATGGVKAACLIYIVHVRVHVKMAAATIEIVFDGGFNDILLDYLDMQGRSSSEEAAFDDDASDYSSSGNDSDIVRAISADILRNGESIRCLGLQPASAPQPRAPRRLPSDSHSVGDAKRDNGCKCLIGDYIDTFGGEKFFLREQLMAVSTTCHMDLATSLGPCYFVKDCLSVFVVS